MLKKIVELPGLFYARDGKRLSLVAYAFLTLLCIGFFIPGIATMPPTDRDEASFAQASKQMVETGNYTDIRLQDQPRYKKPIGIYWLQSASVRVLSPHHLNEIWAYRVPSFIGATVAVLMTAALGALLFNPATGLLGAIMLAGCILLNVEAHLAKTDAALLACVVTAMYGAARAYKAKLDGVAETRLLVPALFWTAIAVGVLIKGPIILLPIVGLLLWLRLSDKNLSWFRALRPGYGLLYALVLIAPWFISISMQSHGAFFQQSAGHDMFAKIWQGQNRGMMPPGMHLMAFPIMFFPFSLFAMFALPDIWKNRKDATVKFCLGWIVPMWIVFELSFTKLPHYVLPAYPAIALLTAKFLVDGFPVVSAVKRRLPITLVVGFWMLIGIGLAYLSPALFVYSTGTLDIAMVFAGVFLILSQHLGLFLLIKNKAASLMVMTVGALVFLPMTFGYALPRANALWMSREIVQLSSDALKAANCERAQIVSVGYKEPSLVFLAGTDTILLSSGAEAAEALGQVPCRVAVIDASHKQEFIDAFANDGNKPQEACALSGLNAGHGSKAALTLFILPKEKP